MRVVVAGALAATACRPTAPQYPHRSEPIGTVRQIYDGVLTPELAVNTFRNIDRLFPTRTVVASSRPHPLPSTGRPFPRITFTDRGARYDLDRYLELNRIAALLILKDGRIALER